MRFLIREIWVLAGCVFWALPAGATAPLASDALPGVHRTGFATPLAPAVLSGALSVGYGFTEAQGNGDSAHHRQLSRLGLAVSPSEWFIASLRFDQRFDLHPDDGVGEDDGWVFDPRLGLRFPVAIAPSFRLAPEVVAWLPGSESAGTSFESTTLDGRVLATYVSEGLHAGAALGYRLDNSGKAGEDAARLRPGDRLALGLSDYDAALIALGASYDFGGTVLKGELSADVLIGSGAPPLSQSPLRAAIGLNQALGAALSLDVTAETSLSSRPDVGPGEPLIPIEPRVLGLVGLRYALDPTPAVAPPPPPPAVPAKPAPTKPVEPPKPATVPVEIQLTDDEGQPIVDARVTLEVDGQQHELAPDGEGRYKLEAVPVGKGRGKLRASGEGIQPIETDVALERGTPVKVAAKAPVALPSAQVRGLVRSFQGKPLSAKIRLEPGGKEATTDDKGFFVVDVEPGQYEVVIEAAGFETQRRSVKVEKQGVVVLNADLVKARLR